VLVADETQQRAFWRAVVWQTIARGMAYGEQWFGSSAASSESNGFGRREHEREETIALRPQWFA
jgi:hypothetical protein